MKFNSLQFNSFPYEIDVSKYSLSVLSTNDRLLKVQDKYKKIFNKQKVKNISFSKDGFCSLILSLKGKVAVSLGESEYLVQGAKKAKEFKEDIELITINKDGTLDLSSLDDSFDFIFVSSYIVDTYVKVDLNKIKQKTSAVLISNATVDMKDASDIYLLDSYKLCSFGGSGVAIYDEYLEDDDLSQIDLISLELSLSAYENKKQNSFLKNDFLNEIKEIFRDDLFFFIDPTLSLDFTLHLGLKDIKMREIIRTLAFEDIFVTNGEGCSLGLSRPSRIIQEMGYSEDEARWGLSLDFSEELNSSDIKDTVEKIYKKYRQIKALR